MEIRDIEYFCHVAKTRHVGKAAEIIGLSQPALSKSMRRLENELNASLFRRTPKGMEVTAVGEMLLAHAKNLSVAFDDLRREARNIVNGQSGLLRVGANPAIADYLLSDICATCLAEARGIRLSIMVDMNSVLVPALRDGVVDLIVSGIPPSSAPDFTHEPLLDDEFVVVASASHPLARKKHLCPKDLVPYRWILSSASVASSSVLSRQHLTQSLRNHDLPEPVIALETNSTHLMMRTIAGSDLLGFQSRQVIQSAKLNTRELRIAGLAWYRRVGITYRRHSYLPHAGRRFIQLLHERANREQVPAKAAKLTTNPNSLRQQ
ncbi:MAG: LysR family transcriptional regulator [Burkholderiales bacterium]|nr:LysR family transcriptional regulator [Burkholderiales bacterium]